MHDARYYLGKLWYDAVAYGSEELEFVAKTSRRADSFKRSRSQQSTDGESGAYRMLFGTDYPFFPPLEESGEIWQSVSDNLNAIHGVRSWTSAEKEAVESTNAITLFGL